MPSVRDFAVSVIIPVYNAESYLSKAVESAVNLVEVGEIILIEDQSPDNALALAVSLEQEFDKVKLFQHPDKKNHGAGASRNLGIEKAACEYIAFLDADDYYLPNRFVKDKLVFETHDNCDGVYSAVGTHFYTQEAKNDFFEKGFGYQEILTLTGEIPPEELFSVLFNRHQNIKGEFCTNGITVKKSVFKKVGYFNTALKLRQDIHLWRRLAGFCDLYPGEIVTPTAMRGIHASNRMTKLEDHKQYTDLWWRSLKKEFKSKHIEKSQYNIFLQCYFNYLASQPNKIIAVKSLIDNVLKYPKIIRESYGDFDFNFWKVFGKNWLTLKLISFKNRSICFFRKKWYQLKCLETPKLKLVYPIQRNHFYNEEGHYYISTNSKVMSSTLSVAKNLKQANLKTLLVCNIKKRLGLSPRHKFYLIVRHPSKRLESYYNDFFGNRVDRLGKTHFKLEYSHTEILRNLGHNVRPDDICFKNTLSEISYEGVVKILPKITKKDSHLIPQYYLLKWKFGNIKSQLKMDKVLKMENPKDLKFIANQLKIDVSKRYNKSISKKVTALTLDSYEIINEVYKEDFERFNYE